MKILKHTDLIAGKVYKIYFGSKIYYSLGYKEYGDCSFPSGTQLLFLEFREIKKDNIFCFKFLFDGKVVYAKFSICYNEIDELRFVEVK